MASPRPLQAAAKSAPRLSAKPLGGSACRWNSWRSSGPAGESPIRSERFREGCPQVDVLPLGYAGLHAFADRVVVAVEAERGDGVAQAIRGCEKIMFAIELLQDPLRQAQRPAATLDLPEHPALPVAAAVPGCRVNCEIYSLPAP